jgi:hypothetical protein
MKRWAGGAKMQKLFLFLSFSGYFYVNQLVKDAIAPVFTIKS